MECIIPFITARLVNEIKAGCSIDEILRIGGLLVLMAALSLLFGSLAGLTCSTASCGLGKNLRHDIFHAVQGYSFENIDHFLTSSLVTRMTTDVTNVQFAFMMVIRTAIRSPLMLVFAFIKEGEQQAANMEASAAGQAYNLAQKQYDALLGYMWKAQQEKQKRAEDLRDKKEIEKIRGENNLKVARTRAHRLFPPYRYRYYPEIFSTPFQSQRRTAVNITASSTRRDDLLLDKTTLDRMWILRKYLADMNPIEAMDFVKDRLEKTRDNDEFLMSMNS